MGRDPAYPDWELTGSYSVEEVADRLVTMFYDELYLTEFPPATSPPAPLGMLVAGYSAGAKAAEARVVLIEDPQTRPTPELVVAQDQYGWIAFAQPEATERLFNGFDSTLRVLLQQALPPTEWLKVSGLFPQFTRQPVLPAMPFGDAIDLSRFLVDVTIGYNHYLLGPDIVGGPVEVAGITRHEGFKWVSRKHYYSATLNPEEPRHAD